MTTTGETEHVVERWETVAVTALPPGWRNVYSDEEGEHHNPCPALLLQEHRRDIIRTDVPRGDGTFKPRIRERECEAPYETRVVYADEQGGGWLDDAAGAKNYLRTDWCDPCGTPESKGGSDS